MHSLMHRAQGMSMAVLQGGVLNLACLFPPIYIQGFVVGAGLSGVGTSVLSFITQLRAKEAEAASAGSRTPAEVAPAAFAYFAASASVTALCVMAFTMLGRLEYSRARLAAHYAAGEEGVMGCIWLVQWSMLFQGLLSSTGGLLWYATIRASSCCFWHKPGRDLQPRHVQLDRASSHHAPPALYLRQLPSSSSPILLLHTAPELTTSTPPATVRRHHHGEGPSDGLQASLLDAPYDEQFSEEGEPLPAIERYYWPAAMIPYLHPATMIPEQSIYWAASPNDDAMLGGSEDPEEGAHSCDPEDPAEEGQNDRQQCDRQQYDRQKDTWGSGASGATQASAPMAVPTTRRSGSWGALAGSAPHAATSYDSGGGGGEGPSPYRCGTALRFYRSSSASALKGMLEAALAAQQQQLMWSEQQGVSAAYLASSSAQVQWQQQQLQQIQQQRRTSVASSQGIAPVAPCLEPAPRQGRGKGSRAVVVAGQKQGQAERSVWPFVFYATSIVICMAGSLAVWPGVTAFICSEHNPALVSPCAPRAPPYGRLSGDLFVPAMFVIFSLGDVTGRIASSWGPWGRHPPPAAALFFYSVLRLAVVCALLLCHVVTPEPWQLPFLLRSDWWPVGLVLALGLTQGHLLSTACMHAPAVLPPGKEAKFGPVTGFCITAGCLAGSVISTFLVERFTLMAAV